MQLSLIDVAVRNDVVLIEKHRINSVDAVEVFRLLWEKMTKGPNSKEIQNAVSLIEKTFNV